MTTLTNYWRTTCPCCRRSVAVPVGHNLEFFKGTVLVDGVAKEALVCQHGRDGDGVQTCPSRT